jgi:hypothetical protein
VNRTGDGTGSFFYFLLPYIEQDNVFKLGTVMPSPSGNPQPDAYWDNFASLKTPAANVIKTYQCPSDPGFNPPAMWTNGWVAGCYAENCEVFGDLSQPGWAQADWGNYSFTALPASIPDGLSNTIGVAEKLSRCLDRATLWGHGSWDRPWEPRFNSFELRGPGSKFQVQPNTKTAGLPESCNPRLPSTYHTAGCQVMLMDGSVRNLSRNLDANLWWAACTPNGGETLGNGW